MLKHLRALFLVLLSLALISESAYARKKKGVKVKPTDVISTTTDSGKSLDCARIKGNWQPGKLKKRGKKYLFILESGSYKAKLKKLRAKKGRLSKKKYKKSLKKIKKLFRDKKTACRIPEEDSLAPHRGALTRAQVKYLYEKAGLGVPDATAYEVGTGSGASALADYFLTYRSDPYASEARRWLDEDFNVNNDFVTERGIQLYALYILLNTPNQFHERLAFNFWHNYFATSMSVLSSSQRSLMFDHLNIMRWLARYGDFRTALKKVTRDPVMLIWLSGADNTAQEPNENYARELMELFTVGTEDSNGNRNYSETTVAQAARACTGWTVQQVDVGNDTVWAPVFSPVNFDNAPKTVFEGRPYQGTVTDDYSLIDHILDNHPEAPRYLAKRILMEYIREHPSEKLVSQLAKVIKDSNYNMNTVFKTLLSSRAFYADKNRDTILKNPVHLMVEFIRSTGIPYDIGELRSGLYDSGMIIGQPPTVFGWDNPDWATGQWKLRIANLITQIVRNDGRHSDNNWSFRKLLPSAAPTEAELIAHLEAMLGVSLSSVQKTALNDYLNNVIDWRGELVPQRWDPRVDSQVRAKVAGLLRIITSSVQFQSR
ncbi:MAG: DUF1800 family protein [Candidatus Dadabacteria bacterium]|nr:MAG: DUF1800 family protein [Candidatus Dadabacteria bacterium]